MYGTLNYQAENILSMLHRSTVSLTAARGRGKSAALGLAIAAAVGFGYSNIFVTSPSPENLHTLFDFVFKVKLCLSKQMPVLQFRLPGYNNSTG